MKQREKAKMRTGGNREDSPISSNLFFVCYVCGYVRQMSFQKKKAGIEVKRKRLVDERGREQIRIELWVKWERSQEIRREDVRYRRKRSK